MVGTPRCGVRTSQRDVPTLQKIQGTQVLSRLIKTAAAERGYEFPSRLQPIYIDSPFAPGERVVIERERIGVFIFKHARRLLLIPPVLRRQDRRPDYIQESVHLRLHFLSPLPERMMQTGCEFDR